MIMSGENLLTVKIQESIRSSTYIYIHVLAETRHGNTAILILITAYASNQK
jgi:hypothetical protein